MFEFVRKHNRILQFALVLVIVPSFIFVGVEGYTSFMNRGQGVAEVNGTPITQTEWDAAHRRQVERMRQQMPGMDPAAFDQPAFKRETLEALIRQQVLRHAADDQRLVTPDARLQRLFVADPQLAFLRNPDGSVNAEALVQQGLSSAQLAARLRQDYASQQVLAGIASSVPKQVRVSDLGLDALLQQREIQILKLPFKDYAAQLHPSDDALKKYFEDASHAHEFVVPEKADIDYVVLDLEAAKKLIQVSDGDLRKYYDENVNRFSDPEERQARHILIKVDAKASTDARQAAREQAAALVLEARKSPDKFADLARKSSQDSGSAASGGDLGYFGKGAMVPAFESAVFAMKPGDISEVVESDFGFHVIQLVDVRGGTQKTFDQVKAQIQAEVETQLARQKYIELAEQFTNMVYEQSDSLQPVADKLKLKVQSVAGLLRQPVRDANAALAHPKLLAAVFDMDNIRQQRNTEAIEVAPNQLVSARVKQHTPSQRRSFDEVKDEVKAAVIASEAKALATKAGEEKLAAARESGALTGLAPAKVVSRFKDEGLGQDFMEAVLKADLQKAPSWVGLAQEDAFTIVRVNKIVPPESAMRDGMRASYAQAWGQAEQEAYYSALRSQYKVKETLPALRPQASQ